MEIAKIVYIAEVCEYYDEQVKKVWTDILETKDAAIRFCTDIVKQRYKEIHQVDSVTELELAQFMKDERYEFRLSVFEFGGNRYNPDKPEGRKRLFHRLVQQGGKDLYSNLLNTVNDNWFMYDYLGNLIDAYTEPFGWVSFIEGRFTEEDCKDGVYKGSFKYILYDDDPEPQQETNKVFYYRIREMEKAPDLMGRTYDMNSWYYNSYEKALKSGINSLYWEMDEYLPRNETLEELDFTWKEAIFEEKVTNYSVKILVTHGNKLIFENQQELKKYYTEIMESENMTVAEFYEFLLSLVKYEERTFDKDGKLLATRIIRQEVDNDDKSCVPEFQMETVEEVLRKERIKYCREE